MSIRLCGAVCVAAACALAGIRKNGEYRRNAAAAKETCLLIERLETEICRLAVPLPEVIARLPGDKHALFSSLRTAGSFADGLYSETLLRAVDALELPAELKKMLGELFSALARGGEPERAFAVCRTEAEHFRTQAERLLAERGRLAVSVGICTGAMLGITLC